MSQTETAPAAPAAPKGRSKLLKLGVPVLVLLLGGGGGGWWYFFGRGSSDVEAAAPAPDPAVATFEPFVVNLADPGGRRFLRVSLQLLVPGESMAAEIKENKLLHFRVRSSILELLTTQTSAGLATPEGRTALKKAIAETATHALEHTEVSDVLFAEFVIQ
jgi:flagellar FliL protein